MCYKRNMNKLSLNLNKESLLSLMKDYYELTKTKIAVFDINGNKLLGYPHPDDCYFCSLIKRNKKGKIKCKQSDKASFENVKKSKQLVIYHCHAGLVEASFPLISEDTVIGYIMFGQITDIQNKEELKKHLNKVLKNLNIKNTNKNDIYKIKYRSESQIKAAAKLLEACTFYVLLKDYVSIEKESFIGKINKYIDLHIDKEISISDLCDFFNISKSNLYIKFNEYNSLGIAEYIKQRRIEKARLLLKKTDYKIIEISEKVGFNDYNYFCRVFKKINKISAKKYREINK